MANRVLKLTTAVALATGASLVLWVAAPFLWAPPAPSPVSLILHNGTVLTMEEEMPEAQALAIRGDRIEAVGSEGEVLAFQEAGTRIVDLEGRTVLPGFIDSHAHWIGDRDRAGGETAEDAIEAALRSGWTSISELFVNQERLDELMALDESGNLRIRVNAYLPVSWEYERFGTWYQAYEPGHEFSPYLRIGGVKLFLDWGWGRYSYFTQEELNQLIAEVHGAGFQVAVHTVVEPSHDLLLNAFEAAVGEEDPAQFRLRLEHAVELRDDQIERMRQMGAIASIQLTVGHSDWIEELESNFTADRLPLLTRWRDLLEAGVPAIGSTDRLEDRAFSAIYQAVTRIGNQGLTPRPWMLAQRITVEQALRLLTIDAAYGHFQEDVMGSLAPGKLADLVIVTENPADVPSERLKDIRVLVTMVGGRAEYCAPDAETLCPQAEFFQTAWASGSVLSTAPERMTGKSPERKSWLRDAI